MNLSFSRALPGAGLITLLSVPTQALELQAVAYAETMYSDNATDLKYEHRGDFRNTVGLDAQLTEQRQSLEADVNVTMEHQRYLRETSGERTEVTSGLGMLNLNLVDDALHWGSSFTRDQVVQDYILDESLSERTYRNTLSSGPQLTLELTDTTNLDTHVQYINVENSDELVSDSERANSGITLQHQYNQLTQFNLSSQYETILSEDELDPFDRKSVSVGLTRSLIRSSFSFNVGRTSLEPESGDSIDSNFYQINYQHNEFLLHQLQLGYTQDVSDTSMGFTDQPLIDVDTGELPVNDYVTSKRWSGSLRRVFGFHSYTLSGARSDSHYELSQQRTLFNSVVFRYERSVMEHLVAGGSLSFSRHNYVDDPVKGLDKTLIYTVDSNYQFSSRLSAGSFIRFVSTENKVNKSNAYEEFRLGMDLRYQLF